MSSLTRALVTPVPLVSPTGVHVLVPPSLVATRLAGGYGYCPVKACRPAPLTLIDSLTRKA